MQIRINVKGASRKKAAIVQTTCDYPDRQMTVDITQGKTQGRYCAFFRMRTGRTGL